MRVVALVACIGACGPQSAQTHTAWRDGSGWQLPAGFPTPVVPADNPMSEAKVVLGRTLFFDKKLSRTGTYSCASCHDPDMALTDGRVTAIGATNEVHPRQSMSLVNVAYAATLTWGNPLLRSLERQSQLPLFGDSPVEMGLRSSEDFEHVLRSDQRYRDLFASAFPETPEPLSLLNATRAIASYERTLISRGDSPYDRFVFQGDALALSESARRGLSLFESERLGCSKCHSGFALSGHVRYIDAAGEERTNEDFFNTGLYNVGGVGAYPAPNTGIHNLTDDPADMGKFKPPSLRNVAITAPYMHDGSVATLSDVLDHYAAGGRTISEGPQAGVGSQSPLKSSLLKGFSLSTEERQDLLAFFDTLSDVDRSY